MDTSSAQRAIVNRIRKAHLRSAKPADRARHAVLGSIGRHPFRPCPDTVPNRIGYVEPRSVGRMGEAFAHARAKRSVPPCPANFICGRLLTGDLRKAIMLGGHGPLRMRVIVVDNA